MILRLLILTFALCSCRSSTDSDDSAGAQDLVGDGTDRESAAEVTGVTLTRIAENRVRIEDEDISVSDWTIRISNTASERRWVATVGQKTTTNYLVVRNPKQISYLILEKVGTEWRDSHMGWSTVIGPKDGWIAIKPGESMDFVVPIADRFKTSPATVRLQLNIATDEAKQHVTAVWSKSMEHRAESSSGSDLAD